MTTQAPKGILLAGNFIFILILLSGSVKAQNYSERQLNLFNTLTTGVTSLGQEGCRFSAIGPLTPDILPLFWGDEKAYAGDIRWPQCSYPPVAVACEYQQGRFVALGHDGLLTDPASDNFTVNIFNWLGNGYTHKKVIIYTHLGNWLHKNRLTETARKLLEKQNVEIAELNSPVTDDDLKTCDVLIIVRPSRLIEEAEVRSILSYVEQGGGLLMTGIGWFWEKQGPSHTIQDFPLNRLGEHLGFEYSQTSIGQTPIDNKGSVQRYSTVNFQPLSARHPIEVKTYSIEQDSNRSLHDRIIQNTDVRHSAVEGQHVIVSMPYRFWAACRKPVDFVRQLDAVYTIYADLTDGIKPFGGHKIMILNVDHLRFHMCSGNPILSREDRIEYILSELEKSNYQNPSWGLMHELGHDFIIGMKHGFVFGDGDNESWAVLFPLYGCRQLGITPRDPIWKTPAKAYHESGKRNFNQIRNDTWLMIGFLDEIRNQYGWDVYRNLFERYAQVVTDDDYPDINLTKNDVGATREKVDFFVKELSLAAGVNFYPYFKRWGFPVSSSVNKELRDLPKAALFQ